MTKFLSRVTFESYDWIYYSLYLIALFYDSSFNKELASCLFSKDYIINQLDNNKIIEWTEVENIRSKENEDYFTLYLTSGQVLNFNDDLLIDLNKNDVIEYIKNKIAQYNTQS